MLKVQDLSLNLNGKPILRNINLSIHRGEIHSILGANGTGKTSLAYVLMGLYRPTSGRIIFEGEDITKLSVHERAKRGITLAWQEPARFEGLTVGEYLHLSRERGGGSLSPERCLEMVGLTPSLYLGRPVDQTLSGGERKRIELASVLAMEPKLAILDEPDSGIDAPSLDQVANVIRTLAKGGSSVLLITHHEQIAEIADRASSLCGGIILKTASPEEVVRFFRNHCRECLHVNRPEEELVRNF
ncbi:MAG TPA: ABC transporter ATP-binding protein [Candidatus Latescibacteria bacterium]|nr:ABC transporter ATP-binding protein [Candidatus Latescibacterota bacterium]